jgi:hypothetical protein
MRIGFNRFQEIMNQTFDGTSFDYDGLRILYDYYEDLDEDQVINPVELCCIYSQMTFDEVCGYYSLDIIDGDIKQSVIDFIERKSHLIGYNADSLVFVSF